jgi:GNAT superfamily N-acetyltransferase
VSDERLDDLAESARNRGLKLVRSRVRTPNKRRFGKVGLTDKAGKAVFGMDDKGPAAKPEEVEQYLRNLGAKDWGASLGVAVMPRKRKAPARKAPPAAANDPEPVRERKAKPVPPPPRPKPPPPEPKPPPPPPKPEVRSAKPGDATALVELIRELGHEIGEKVVRRNLPLLKKADEPPLVAILGKQVIGLIGTHRMTVIHRAKPVGRITILIVAKDARNTGVGRMLMEAAEGRLKKAGCGRIEITVGDGRTAARAFYRRLGYQRDSMRFAKTL